MAMMLTGQQWKGNNVNHLWTDDNDIVVKQLNATSECNAMVLMLCGCSHKHQSYGDNVISTSRQQWTVSWKQISMTVSVNGWYQDEM